MIWKLVFIISSSFLCEHVIRGLAISQGNKLKRPLSHVNVAHPVLRRSRIEWVERQGDDKYFALTTTPEDVDGEKPKCFPFPFPQPHRPPRRRPPTGGNGGSIPGTGSGGIPSIPGTGGGGIPSIPGTGGGGIPSIPGAGGGETPSIPGTGGGGIPSIPGSDGELPGAGEGGENETDAEVRKKKKKRNQRKKKAE